jgi:hypothetical protein
MTSTGSTRSAINPDGTTGAAANTFGSMGTMDPAGMRQFTDGCGASYFAIYTPKLFTSVGASNATTGGYVQLNPID